MTSGDESHVASGDETTLRELFGDYRAEWPKSLFGSLFIPPPYIARLETNRPCVLMGGRGTGKTTTLKSFRFDAAAARLPAGQSAAFGLAYLGIYVRANKNRMPAFQGPEVAQSTWDKAFTHYFNLLVLAEMCELAQWLVDSGFPQRRAVNLGPVAETLGINAPSVLADFAHVIRAGISGLELFVNNPGRTTPPLFSMAEAPVRAFAEELRDCGLSKDLLIFCCVDEYENLLDYQQAIVNTYVKHSSPPLSYKIGVRRNGLRCRNTIDGGDPIQTPDDYAEIDITEEGFDAFARRVAELRLRRARERNVDVPVALDEFLPDLPLRDEAMRLGCEKPAKEVIAELEKAGDATLVSWARALPLSEVYFLKYWAQSENSSVLALARDWVANPGPWSDRLGNYQYASLFWLSRGRKGATIKKYYAGASTFLAMASGNVRYFLELIDESIAQEFAASERSGGSVVLSARAQTGAARSVGEVRLAQVEGLSKHGMELKRLVLAVGKVFFELARNPQGRQPETNHFVLSGSPDAREAVTDLLADGVAHQAFEVGPRTKATSTLQMRDDEYRLHPIFSAFFEFSHRRKRRITLKADALLRLGEQPSKAMAELLGDVTPTPLEELPTQLAMFETFFVGGTNGAGS